MRVCRTQATLPAPLLAKLPPNYVANYDPDRGAIVKQNKFVRNMASVLRINPGRIRVTNIVPGNRRRLSSGASAAGLDIKFDIAEVDPCEGIVCAHGACAATRKRKIGIGGGPHTRMSMYLESTCYRHVEV